MIIVLDTNVVISGLLTTKGPPAKIIAYWAAEEFDVAISTALLDELARVLKYERVRKRLGKSQEMVKDLLKRFKTVAILTEPQLKLKVIGEDPDDDRVLECAVAAGAAYIVTGDEHLRKLKQYQGIIILSPAGFLTLLNLEGKRKRQENACPGE